MHLIGNILWLIFGGLLSAIGYMLGGLLLCLTILGIPFGVQAIKLAGYALWPFGRTLVPARNRRKGLSVVGNILWCVLAGWWLALSHLIWGCLLCLTIIGIPLGIASFKIIPITLTPLGVRIVPGGGL